jgi:TPR repeat protein
MSRGPIIDPSSFEGLLAAALVLQRWHEQEARHLRPSSHETRTDPPETDGEPHCAEHDATSARPAATLGELSEAAQTGTDENTVFERAAALSRTEQLFLPVERQAGDQKGAPHRSSSRPPKMEKILGWRVPPQLSRRIWVTFDSKFTLSQRRVVLKVAKPLLVLLIMVAFTLTQVWPRGHFLTVAAVSRMNHPSDEGTVRKVTELRPIPPDQISHMRVTDQVVLSVVEALSRYEIPGLRRQAAYGDDSAAFIMGMVYETGHLVPQSCTKAAAWVTSSANAGNVSAQYNLGLRYRNGDGVPGNEEEAEKWLRKAADRQYSNATLALERPPATSP